MSTFLPLSVAVFFVLSLLLRKYLMSRKQLLPYPPGPKPKPFIGNTFDIPTKDIANVYIEWGKKYNSSVIYASTLGTHIVILNKLEDAIELLERRAMKYSDRPQVPIRKLMGIDRSFTNMRYGDRWRYRRKICQQHFQQEAAKNHHTVLQKVHAMLDGLLKSPEKFDSHNKMLSVAIAMKTMYGYDVESVDDPCVINPDKSAKMAIPLSSPGATLINIFPILAFIPPWFPGATSQKLAAEVKRLTDEIIRAPMDWAKMRISEGTAVPSLVTNFLEKKKSIGASQEEEKAIGEIAYTVYGATSSTMISATGSFLYYMAINPVIQETAQREIDRIIGTNRLPDLSDRTTMPYVEAIYREVLRIRPPAPLGAPHCVTEDDYYKEYLIPKGTILLGNIWAMTHDESIYPEPFAFKPERFLDKNGGINEDDRVLAYGFGRRICVGKHIAGTTLWLTIVSILATFNIKKTRDDSGNEIAIDDEYEDLGLHIRKKHFECSITPRSHGHRQLIEEANFLLTKGIGAQNTRD